MLEFKEITPENWRIINCLQVKDEQKAFVANNTAILARAFAYRMCNSKVFALYIGEEAIGLIMQRDYQSNGDMICILDQIMIDKNYQGQGYGKAAMRRWIDKIKGEKSYSLIKLCYIEGDIIAEKLYKDIGFIRKFEEDDGDELVMIYKL